MSIQTVVALKSARDNRRRAGSDTDAQGRATGWILCGLPFAMFIVMNLFNPGYGKALFQDPSGQKMVLYAGIMMVIGILWIRKIVDIKY